MLVHDTTITDDLLITGAQWRLFYQHLWPKDWYIDDVGVAFEDDRGLYILDDTAIHRLGDFGMVGYQGNDRLYDSGALFPVRMLYEAVMIPHLDTHTVLSFSIPNTALQAFLEHAKNNGYTPF